MTLLEIAKKILEEEKKPLNSMEIWDIANKKGYVDKQKHKGKTPWNTISARIYTHIKENPNSPFVVTKNSPKKFYLREFDKMQNYLELNKLNYNSNKRDKEIGFLEEDLHPYLTYYAYKHLKCYTKTILHSKSSKKEFAQWLHPDMVGCYFPLEDWENEVYELCSSLGSIPVKFISFEIKRELNFGNLRECFFQTVSNSSWANESYLVTARISDNEDFLNELSRLSSSFGIGVIQLCLNAPDNSKIIFSAKYREMLDWETINKLTINEDFKEFITNVKTDIFSKKIHKKEYNSVPDIDDLKK